jgi:serine/threonine-protein kinase PRP4
MEPEIDEEALIEARRRKREAILAKYQGQSTPSLVDNLKIQSQEGTPVPGSPLVRLGIPSPLATFDATDSPRPPPSRDFTPDFEQGDEQVFDFAAPAKLRDSVMEEGPSAADYDPMDDMKLDDVRQKHQHETVPQLDATDYNETKPIADQDVLIPQTTPPVAIEQPPADEDEDDMFATPLSKTHQKAIKDLANKAVPVIAARQLDASLLDIWHDAEGYYLVTLGELINNRYVVQANLGKGMFSNVVRCIDNQEPGKLVAIKILRNNDAMRKAGLKEIGILRKLQEADPEGRKHVIRLEGSFDFKGHLCLVFENLSLNLREVLKRFGRDVGINLKAVRAYAQQMFVGLSLLRKCNFVHADLKPDNILVCHPPLLTVH